MTAGHLPAPHAHRPTRATAADGAMPRVRMFQNLAVDANLLGNLEAPGGAVFAHDWRFVLTTPTAVLTAECTHSQVHRLVGEMTPALLSRTCRTSWQTT
jgi:hypothetical protein